MHWNECRRLISNKLKIKFQSPDPYKLCDIRPAYGNVFDDYIKNYDFYGFGDIDVIYGNIRKFVTSSVLDNDCITFNNKRINGHLCFIRNNETLRSAYQKIPDWKKKMEHPKYLGIDEDNQFYGIQRVFARESFNTPLSPFIPWMNGGFEFPTEWYWKDGKLTNNQDKDCEFLYLHFMRMKFVWNEKGIKNMVHFNEKKTCHGWRINLAGFFALTENEISNPSSVRAGFD